MTEKPSPSPPEPRSRSFLLRAYCWGLVLLLIYVLSSGPMYWAAYEAYHLSDASPRSRLIVQLYYPLARASEVDVIGDFVSWYVGLWIFENSDPPPVEEEKRLADRGNHR